MCEKDKTYKLLEIGPNDDNTNNDSVPIRNRERERVRERERERIRGMGSADTLVVLGTFADVVFFPCPRRLGCTAVESEAALSISC